MTLISLQLAMVRSCRRVMSVREGKLVGRHVVLGPGGVGGEKKGLGSLMEKRRA